MNLTDRKVDENNPLCEDCIARFTLDDMKAWNEDHTALVLVLPSTPKVGMTQMKVFVENFLKADWFQLNIAGL